MAKRPIGESPEANPNESMADLRKRLESEGLNEDQIDRMFFRIYGEEIYQKLDTSQPVEPDFIFQLYEEKLGRPLQDYEKMAILEGLKDGLRGMRRLFGVDKSGKQKMDS